MTEVPLSSMHKLVEQLGVGSDFPLIKVAVRIAGGAEHLAMRADIAVCLVPAPGMSRITADFLKITTCRSPQPELAHQPRPNHLADIDVLAALNLGGHEGVQLIGQVELRVGKSPPALVILLGFTA